MEAEHQKGATVEMAALFAGLGSEARLRIVMTLAPDREGRIVADLLGELGIPASTLSHHLESLRRHGWVTVERSGTFLRYRVRREAIEKIARFASELRKAPRNRASAGGKKGGTTFRSKGATSRSTRSAEVEIEFD